MRLVRVGLLAAAMTALALACGSFGTDAGGDAPAMVDGGTSSSGATTSSSSSGQTDSGDAGEVSDAGLVDAGDCFDFRNSNTNGFETRGVATPKAEGYEVVVTSTSTENAIRKTFTLSTGITSSRVAIDMEIKASETFQNDEYADMLTLFYGLPATFGAHPDTALTQFEAVAGGNVDVDMWDQGGGAGYSFFDLKRDALPLVSTGDFVVIETHWPSPGQHELSSGTSVVKIESSLSKQTKNDLTVEIGGRQGDPGDPPQLTLTLHRLCVKLQ